MIYKLHLPKNTIYYSDTDGTNRVSWFDYWTSIKSTKNLSNSQIIKRGKRHLKEQIAEKELFSIRLWKTIDFSNADIEVVIVEGK